MTQYKVCVTSFAADKIGEYGRYIAEQSGSLAIAECWINHVYTTIETLHYSPHRHGLAEEDKYRDFELRRQIIGNYLAIYAVDDAQRIVSVVGFRHGRRLPRPDELPISF